MLVPALYRYFLGFRPDPILRDWLETIAIAAGQLEHRIKTEYLHLTLCVVAEPRHRDDFIARRIDAALAGRPLSSFPFQLGKLRGGPTGATLRATGSQHALQHFYRMLLACLAEQNILPLHRKMGLHPHLTLGYDPCFLDMLDMPREWIPDELLLIESQVGFGTHTVLKRWPMLPPPQGSFPFDNPSPPPLPPLLAATG